MEINTRNLEWDSVKRIFSAEASTLTLQPGEWPQEISLRSHKTGNLVLFNRPVVVRDLDGDVASVQYFPERGTLAMGTKLIIFND